jgi:hypothetical protein
MTTERTGQSAEPGAERVARLDDRIRHWRISRGPLATFTAATAFLLHAVIWKNGSGRPFASRGCGRSASCAGTISL